MVSLYGKNVLPLIEKTSDPYRFPDIKISESLYGFLNPSYKVLYKELMVSLGWKLAVYIYTYIMIIICGIFRPVLPRPKPVQEQGLLGH